MTSNQIKVCKEYLEIISLIQEVIDQKEHETGDCVAGNYYTWVPEKYEAERKRAHKALLDEYGFVDELETNEVTSQIERNWTPADLHERLIRIKRYC
jgi:hypothetical protein